MMHVVIFPTWDCQLSCAYCSIRHSKIDRSVAGVPWPTWFDALTKALPKGSLIDIAGGEPFLYAGLLPLVANLGAAGYRWAITTNAIALSGGLLGEFLRIGKQGCACLNVSDHAGNPEAHDNIRALRAAGYTVNVHRVNHPAAGHHEPDAQLITYQDWSGGHAVDGKHRRCTAGINHWIAAPNGDMWRCIVAAQTGQPAGANLFTGEVKAGTMDCDFGCSSCYTEDPASWGIRMEEVVVCPITIS